MSVTLRQHPLKFGPQKNHTPEDEDWCDRAYRSSPMKLECLANCCLPHPFPPLASPQGMETGFDEATPTRRSLRIRSVNMMPRPLIH